MMFPKKTRPSNEMTVEDYKKAVESGTIAFPKKSKLQPGKSKTMKAVCPESALQKAANDLIELKRWAFVRFEDWFLTWIRLNAPVHVAAHFFGQVGGKMPDNLILVELGEGYFLGCKMELKTEDSKGRAVGRLHGKQKRYANAEGWQIARNTKQIEEILQRIEIYAEKIKNITH
jgi:hypothetical protein